jgi:hypothetical protein
MFDPAQCAAMRVEARPEVDGAALRILKNTIADLRASTTGSMLQPYRFPQPNQGDTDETRHSTNPPEAAAAV